MTKRRYSRWNCDDNWLLCCDQKEVPKGGTQDGTTWGTHDVSVYTATMTFLDPEASIFYEDSTYPVDNDIKQFSAKLSFPLSWKLLCQFISSPTSTTKMMGKSSKLMNCHPNSQDDGKGGFTENCLKYVITYRIGTTLIKNGIF